jgi:hypothetical protein
MSFDLLALLGGCFIAAFCSGLAGFAFNLVTDVDVAVRQNPQTLARAWAIGITGILALSVASALLFRMINTKT